MPKQTSEYNFFISHLRFVANKTQASTPDVDAMMAALLRIADEIENTGRFRVEYEHARYAGRALAGVAGFLQQHILPEVIAAKNDLGERQVRWVIDTSMSMLATLTMHAETVENDEPFETSLPPLPLLN